MTVKTAEGVPLTIRFHVADVKRPILSVKRLADRGYTVIFTPEGGVIRGQHGGELALQVHGATYVLPLVETEMCVQRSEREGMTVAGAEAIPALGQAVAVRAKAGVVPIGTSQAVVDAETEVQMEGQSEQGPKARSLPQPAKRPSEESVQEHRQTHLPHAPWCEICREARMKEGPHRPVHRDELGDGPTEVQLDYMFETCGDIMVTILTMRWPMSGWCNATVVPSKGPVQWAVEWILRSLRAAGQQRFLLKTDAEPAIESLANAVVSRLDNESTVRAAPR
eukprot:6482384-Amphidinium_carterae.1